MSPFLRSGSIIAGVLILQVIGVAGGLYEAFDWYDIPMHFLGGYAMSVLALDLWQAYVGSYSVQGKGALAGWVPTVVMFAAVIGFVAVVSIAWEWFEYVVDQLFHVSIRSGLSQMSLADTLGDFVNDLLGGAVGFFVFRDRK